MEKPILDLEKLSNDDWLICHNSHQFTQYYQQFYLELTQLLHQGIPPKILLAERDPVRFLAGFIAACAAGCPVFLSNPNWVRQEWQQVFKLVQPDLILGYGDWGVRDYYPNPEPPILNPQWIMIPTGGSSGEIRYAIHTWETLIASVRGFQQYFQLSQVNSLCVLPLYHVSGLMQFLRSFSSGGKLKILPFKELTSGESSNIEPSKFFISLVPTQLQRLLQNAATASQLSHFQTVLLGGAPAWPELLEQARRHRIRLAPTYGMTETASQIVTLKPQDFLESNNSCGQVLPHAQVTIRNSTGQLLSANQTGNITIKTESLALGYYPHLFTNLDNFQLDDQGFFDDQGYLNIIGRNSNKIITGGENVFPLEVETAIRATQLVTDVCAIGIPDFHWGQIITAIYVPIHSNVSTTALQTALKDKLSKYKQPKHWIPLASLPRNPQGKINRQQLQQIATTSLQNSP